MPGITTREKLMLALHPGVCSAQRRIFNSLILSPGTGAGSNWTKVQYTCFPPFAYIRVIATDCKEIDTLRVQAVN